MSSFNADLTTYNIVTENELAEVLSHYSSEFVFNVVNEVMKSRFTTLPIIPMSNLIYSWEVNFKAIMANYGSESYEEVNKVRDETYKEVIEDICNEFKLDFTSDDNVDLYTAAYNLYDLLVCKFASNMINFYANFIYRERASLYDNLGLANTKKNKDSTTIYGKKIYKDIRLAVINTNIDQVINAVNGMDISFSDILGLIYGANSNMRYYMYNLVEPKEEFLETAYLPIVNSELKPEVITSIRFALQEIAVANDEIITVTDEMIEKENTDGDKSEDN